MSDLANKKCIPCEGNIPPFNVEEIHQYLKQIDSDTFEQFLRIRKLMYNWVKHNNVEHEQELKKFTKSKL